MTDISVLKSSFYFFLTDFQNRYRLSFFGYIWFFIKPFSAFVPIFFIGREFDFAKSVNLPYHIFILTGLLLWNAFWDSFTMPLSYARRFRKVFANTNIDPIHIVFAAWWAALINFTVGMIGLLVVTEIFAPNHILDVFTLPLAIPPLLILGGGLAMLALPMAFVYQDIQQALGYMGSLLMWATPIVYLPEPGSLVSKITSANPLSLAITWPRSHFFLDHAVHWEWLFTTYGFFIAVFFLGRWFLNRQIGHALEHVF